MYFARRTVAHLLCKTYSHCHARPISPSLAYLDLSDITQQRRVKLGDPSAALSSHPVNAPRFRRAQKLLRRFTPADLFEDPYLFALLVAIAQAQHRRLYKNSNEDISVSNAITPPPPSPSPPPPSPPPPTILLVTRPGDTIWLHIYTSNIPAKLLDRLDCPSRPPPTVMPPVTIYRRQLAFKPYETLPQRLAAVVDGKWQEGCADSS